MNAARLLPRLLFGIVLLALGGAIAFAVTASTSLPDGPVVPVWDKAACANCRMHLGEPQFAAQLTRRDGETLFFDDPGCLFAFVEHERPDVHAMWFHAFEGQHWLPPAAVAFAEVRQSPMGFGLGAVPVGTPGAIDLDQARVRCLDSQDRGGGR